VDAVALLSLFSAGLTQFSSGLLSAVSVTAAVILEGCELGVLGVRSVLANRRSDLFPRRLGG